MKFATSAGVALALSFLFYDQRDLATGEEIEKYGFAGATTTEQESLSGIGAKVWGQ